MSENEFPREITESLRCMARCFPVVVVTGARQTGKTTLLTKLFGDYNYVSLNLPAEAKWKELPTSRDFAQALKVHELLGPRAKWPVMVLCRTRQSFPVAERLLAVNAFRLREHLA